MTHLDWLLLGLAVAVVLAVAGAVFQLRPVATRVCLVAALVIAVVVGILVLADW